MSSQPASTSRVVFMSQAEFASRFGSPDFTGAVCGYTPAADTHAVLTLLAQARPRRVLEVGTALGHMTANFTRWTLDDAQIFSLGIVQGMERSAPGAAEQRVDEPTRDQFARFADHFGKAWKVFFITADSMLYDFGRLAPLDFAFIDGGHDLEHALNDSRKAYEALERGGWLVWHDFNSPVPWVKVREAIERLGFAEPVVHVEGTQVAFLRKQAPLPAPRSDVPLSGPVRVAWEGDPEGLHSLALVNRALCRALIDRGHDVGLIWDSRAAGDGTSKRLPLDARLAERVGRGPIGGQAQVHVRHQWPPRLEGPAQGRWVLMQPWEFGSLPKAWLPALHHVDEVWAYSRSVRDCYLDAGMPAERVHVIPLGVAPEVFRPGLEPLALPPGPDFRFLFVGGTIFRKGIDVLLSAFARAFSPGDGVGLVIKDMGSKTFYRGQTAEGKVSGLRERGYSIEYIDRDLHENEIARLYASCDCLVHPFRGEGFALPVVEAMACGLPVIVTGAGPVLDYASEEMAFLIPARRGNFAECRVGDLETIGRPWLWEPDADAVVELLRAVAADRASARARGSVASAWIRERFTWARSAEAIERRLYAIAGKGEEARGGIDPCSRTGIASATPEVAIQERLDALAGKGGDARGGVGPCTRTGLASATPGVAVEERLHALAGNGEEARGGVGPCTRTGLASATPGVAVEERLHALAGNGEEARGGVGPCSRTGVASATPEVATGQGESEPEARACALSRLGFQPDSPLQPSLPNPCDSVLQQTPSPACAGPPTLTLPHKWGGEKQQRANAHNGGGEKHQRPDAQSETDALADRREPLPSYAPVFISPGSPSRDFVSAPASVPSRLNRRAKVSLTMIVRNEEHNLTHCLDSVKGLFDEVIVVDTGSRDRTIEIARSFGARVFDFVWVDDFAAARNAALARATGDYAFWLDADDLIEPPERTKLEALLERVRAAGPDEVGATVLGNGAGRTDILRAAERHGERGVAGARRGRSGNGELIPNVFLDGFGGSNRPAIPPPAFVVRCACDTGPHGEGGNTVVDHIRLFPLFEGVRWTYRVHEQILPTLKRAGVPLEWTEITVRHTGYADRALRDRKLERDSRILREELAERPDDPFTLFNLGSIALERSEWNEALGYLKHSLARSAPTDSITRKLFANIARAHQMLGDFPAAIRTCAEGLSLDPEDGELWFRKAMAHRIGGQPAEAEHCFRRILELSRPQKFASMDQGIYGHLTRRNIAVLAMARGDVEEARRQWRAVLEECPGDEEAMGQLG